MKTLVLGLAVATCFVGHAEAGLFGPSCDKSYNNCVNKAAIEKTAKDCKNESAANKKKCATEACRRVNPTPDTHKKDSLYRPGFFNSLNYDAKMFLTDNGCIYKDPAAKNSVDHGA